MFRQKNESEYKKCRTLSQCRQVSLPSNGSLAPFHRERAVASTPCAESFPGVIRDAAVRIFFPRIVYTPPKALTNFTSQLRLASLFWCCLTRPRKLDESDSKNSCRSFGRKFYISVHFFLSTRRLSTLFLCHAAREAPRNRWPARSFAHPHRRLKMHG